MPADFHLTLHHLPMLELRDEGGQPVLGVPGQCVHPVPAEYVDPTRVAMAVGEQLLPQLEQAYREALAAGVSAEPLDAAMATQLDALFEAHRRMGTFGEVTLAATIVAAVKKIASREV